MDIISLKFALLAGTSFLLFYIVPKRFKMLYLTLLSCGFIATYSYYLIFYVVLFALINYYLGLIIPGARHKKALFRSGILLNILQLVFLKYATFAVDPFFRIFNPDINISRLSEIIIPIGISYFTLQGIGYLINIKMGWEKPEKNFISFLLYISFFPKFLSGPIERSNHFLPQIKTIKGFNEEQISDGLRTVLFGFFKKIAIANQLAPFITGTYSNIGTTDGAALWILLLLQPLYLYFDFSGYTDIAIGFARTFGIELLPNFNRPFFSENMTSFWKRFHISLSSWFNDYIFRQTSFKYRKWGVSASIFAVLLTWTLFGIWHGAGWNFMLLGLVQALAIIYEFFTKKWRVSLFSRLPDFIRIWISRLITYLFYGTSLIFFFSPDLNSTLTFFKRLFVFNNPLKIIAGRILGDISFSVIIFMAVLLIIELIRNDIGSLSGKLESFWIQEKLKNRVFRWITYYVMLALIFYLGNSAQQFIYFQF
jgi:alginate O-acetyltransferase complex protein AlgI